MKILIPTAAIILWLLSVISVSAQQGDPPSAVPDYSPNSWSEYSYPVDNIKFRFPVKPVIEESSLEAGGKKLDTRLYKRGSFIKFSLAVTDQGTRKMEENIKKSDDFLDILVEASVGTNKLVKKEHKSVDGVPGMFFVFETASGVLVRSKLFVLGTKIYVAGTEVKKGERHGFNWENDFEVPAMAFLDSIHIIDPKKDGN